MEEYIIPAALAFIVGLILWLIQRDRITLEYTITESEVFPKNGGQGKYFLLNLKNTGNKAIQNINYKVSLNLGKIESLQFSKKELIDIESQTIQEIIGNISLLNPNEELHSTVTIDGAEDYSKIIILARGIGITASESKEDQLPVYLKNLFVPITVAILASTAFSTYTSLNQVKVNETIKSIDEIKDATSIIKENNSLIDNKLNSYKTTLAEQEQILSDLIKKREKEEEEEKEKEEQGKPEREQIVFAILNKSGLSYIMPQLLANSGDNLTYWKTGLTLMHLYLIDKQNSKKYVEALSLISSLKMIAPSSKGFLLYLAGKIEKEEGNATKTMYFYNLCKKETPLMYEHLMEQDPTYDLKAIEKWMIKHQGKI